MCSLAQIMSTMKIYQYISGAALTALVLFNSCQNSGNNSGSIGAPMTSVQEKMETDAAPNNDNIETIERKLIKNGSVNFRVEDLAESRKEVDQLVKKYKGYISGENNFRSEYEISTNLTVRIPANDFDTFIKELGKSTQYFDQQQVNVEDVTSEYIDVEKRLAIKKALEIRYEEILTKANKVEEIMNVEAQLNEVRSQIESMEGRMQYLKNQVNMATLNVNMYQRFSAPTSFFTQVGEGFKNGWSVFIKLILGVINIWPVIIIFTTAIFLIIRRRRRRRNQA